MARRDDGNDDDGTSAADTYGYTGGSSELGPERKGRPILQRLFAACDDDAVGTVHRAWAVTVLVMVAFFAASIIEATKLNEDYEEGSRASFALELAAYWSAILHLILAITGTFILKRFSTAFTVGCLLGVTVVISQQNLLLFAAFYGYSHGSPFMNIIFADMAFALFVILSFFALTLGHFRKYIITR
mmetsp:Transcript_4817/g.11171  ORF Transcript_4817/g.11171 Transcript_4817/m.11171 type:complete len:187 (-) Transcript_4817:377-937(-)